MTDALLDPELDASRLIPDNEADDLLVGAIDLHTHPAPSPFPRRISILDAARDAASLGFRAIVAKSHHLSMHSDVLALRSAGLDDLPIHVFGGIALNRTCGGINPYAVELILRLGGRVVWMPTISSKAHLDHHHDGGFPMAGIPLREHVPLSILDDDGKLTDEVHDVLAIIAEEHAMLNCGHLSAAEIDVLIPAAVAAGVDRIVVSHPDFIVGADPARVAEWARRGVFIENCLAFMVTDDRIDDLARFEPYIDAAGVSRTIFSSDLGQAGRPLPATAYRRAVRLLLDRGYPADHIRAMIGGNAAQVLFRDGDSA